MSLNERIGGMAESEERREISEEEREMEEVEKRKKEIPLNKEVMGLLNDILLQMKEIESKIDQLPRMVVEALIEKASKSNKVKRGSRPKLKSGYTYERIDAELKKKWERDNSVIIDKSKIKKVKYKLDDSARDAAQDVIPEDIKKVRYEFDEDKIRQAEDVVLEGIQKIKYELKDYDVLQINTRN